MVHASVVERVLAREVGRLETESGAAVQRPRSAASDQLADVVPGAARDGCGPGASVRSALPAPARVRQHRGMTFDFEAPLWEWDARRTEHWTFVSVPEDASDEILERAGAFARGFGSLRVEVTVGGTTWRTSIFPSKTAYWLPVKKAVRSAEGLAVGDAVRVRLRVLDV